MVLRVGTVFSGNIVAFVIGKLLLRLQIIALFVCVQPLRDPILLVLNAWKRACISRDHSFIKQVVLSVGFLRYNFYTYLVELKLLSKT